MAVHNSPDFPVAWEHPEDEHLFWNGDPMHFPLPLVPLEGDWTKEAFAGISSAAQELGFPMSMRVAVHNGRVFQAMVMQPQPEPTPEQAQAMQEHFGQLMGGLWSRWEGEYLPEIERIHRGLASFDYAAATDQQVLEHFQEVQRLAKRIWHIHFLIVFPGHLANSVLDDFYNDVFGHTGALKSFVLSQGLDNLAIAADAALWDLSRKARAVPEVRTVLDEQAAADVIPALHASEAGRAFLAEADAYLQEYGQRSSGSSIADDSWIEDPTPVIKMLKDFVGRESGGPRETQAVLAVEREAAIAAARQTLASYPQAVAGQFEFLLKSGHGSIRVHEDHNVWIDQRTNYRVHQAAVEVGKRLAKAGVLAHAKDVFYLTLAEVHVMGTAAAKPDMRATVAARKAELQRQRALPYPPFIGTMPAGPPPGDPMSRAIGKFFGGPPPAPEHPNEVRGAAGSAGVVTGRVRVAHSLPEADSLQRGEILVTETTSPVWSHLFSIAGAVVTDVGGPLSHCAVVAREYKMPAVVGTGMGTTVLRTGMLVEVDGAQGVVRILGDS